MPIPDRNTTVFEASPTPAAEAGEPGVHWHTGGHITRDGGAVLRADLDNALARIADLEAALAKVTAGRRSR